MITGASFTLVTVTVIVCTSVRFGAPSSVTVTSTTYVLFPAVSPRSVGFSKSGATVNVSTPVAPTIENAAASAPPEIEYVSVCAGTSASVAFTSVTAVWFSAALTAAAAPPPSLVITGASFTCVTVTVAVRVVLLLNPSLATTVMVRSVVVGDSEVLAYWTVRSTVW